MSATPTARPSSAPVPELRRAQTRFAPPQPQTFSDRLNRFFDDLVEQSGLDTTPAVALAATVSVSLILAGAMFVWQENLLASAVGLVVGLGGCLLLLAGLRSWRFYRIQRQLPAAVELMGRSVRAGRSIEQSIERLAEELEGPLGPEFQRLAVRLRLGLPLGAAVRELPRRVPLPGAHIFATAMTIHHQTGGNIIQTLDQLAHTIRERAEFRGRFRAATSGSRLSVIFLLSVGPAAMLFQTFRDPDYLANLTGTPMGQTMLMTAFLLQVIGSIWVWSIFRAGMGKTNL